MPDKALLTGINNYKSISDLRGCLNDVENMKRALTEFYGFENRYVRTLTDQEVTKKELRKQWKWLTSSVGPGDRLVFHFSGHGSYTADLSGDEREDGVDELLCLWDMDWGDDDTYLLDDELQELTGQIPEGALLTVILDCCHSGTGTRMLAPPRQMRKATVSLAKLPLVIVSTSVERLKQCRRVESFESEADVTAAIEEILSPEDVQEAEATVLARFVEPPPEIAAEKERAGVRDGFCKLDLGVARDAVDLNHVLWAGSRSDQTSADAYISSNFNGAFTYYFCETIRKAKGNIGHQEAIEETRRRLSEERFSQIPQLEPEGTTGPLFRCGGDSDDAASATQPSAPLTEPGRDSLLLELLSQLLALLKRELRESGELLGSRARRRGLVYVHGICSHSAGYSEPWWQALARQLSDAARIELDGNRHEVLWSRHVTPTRGAEDAMSRAMAIEQQALADRLRDVLEDRAERQLSVALERESRGIEPAPMPQSIPRSALRIPGSECIDDFMRYLLSDSVREAVKSEFRSVVEPMLQRGEAVEVISHSWGTVVAYEALRDLDDEAFPGYVHNLFTVGSALAIGLIQRRLRPSDGRRPRVVRRWVNLDARGDIVGGSLRGFPFDVHAEYLNLTPTGCDSFGWPIALYAPSCAHSSYFRHDNIPVNRDIFANSIQRALD